MSDFGYRCQMLAETSRRPELMDRMMERMLVSLSLASRVEGGMALDEARTKCIFCRHEGECRYWLDGSETLHGPTDFCPNVEFFRRCAEASAHEPRAAT
jgi:hypothetical protein